MKAFNVESALWEDIISVFLVKIQCAFSITLIQLIYVARMINANKCLTIDGHAQMFIVINSMHLHSVLRK